MTTAVSAPEVLYTIGYQGRTHTEFWNLLMSHDVDALVDVRHNAHWPPNWHCSAELEDECEWLGGIYRHFPKLGIPSKTRKAANSREELLAEYDRLTSRYAEPWGELQPMAPWGILHDFGQFILACRRPALLCAERNPSECHREPLSRITGEMFGIPVEHLT